MTKALIAYIILINIVTFIMMFADKSRAKKSQWRISERTIFSLSFLGGALGSIVGMYTFHHKTKHLSFRILLPLFFVMNLVVLFLLLTGDLF